MRLFVGVLVLHNSLLVSAIGQEAPKEAVSPPGTLKVTRQIGQEYPFSSSTSFTRMALSPDEDTLAALDADFTIHVWSQTQFKLLKTFKIQSEMHPPRIAFLDAQRILVAGGQGRGQILHLDDGATLETWDLGKGSDFLLVPSGKEDALIVGGWSLRSIDPVTGKLLREFRGTDGLQPGLVTAMAKVPKQSVLYTAGKVLLAWDTATGSPLRKIAEFESYVTALATNGEGTKLLTGHRDGTVVEWNLKDGRPSTVLERSRPFMGTVVRCEYGKSDQTIYAVQERSVVEIDKQRIKNTWTVTGHPITAAEYSRKHDLLALAEHGGRVMERHDVVLWNVTAGTHQSHPSNPNLTYMTALSYSTIGERILTVTYGEALLWDIAQGTVLPALPKDLPPRPSGVLSPEGKRLYFSTRSSESIRVWNLEQRKEEGPIPIGQVVRNLTISGNGKVLACESESSLHTVDLETGTLKKSLPSEGFLFRHHLSPDGKLCAVTNHLGLVSLWDLGSGQRLAQTKLARLTVSMDFGKDGELYAGGGKGVTRWDWRNDTQTSCPMEQAVGGVVLIMDDILAVASGPTLRCLNTRTWKLVASASEHKGYITHLIQMAGGRSLATAATDGTVKIWDFAVNR